MQPQSTGQARLFAMGRSVTGYKPKTCKGCGHEFQPLTGNQAWCTKACHMATALATRICAWCGKDFQRHKGGPTTRFCSWQCRDTARYGRKLEVPCIGCGSVFTKRRVNQRWCTKACANADRQRRRKASGAAMSRDWSLAHKGERTCRNCVQPAKHLHHIVPRSRSKRAIFDYRQNGLPLCIPCHRGWHDRVVVIHHTVMSDGEFAFVVQLAGSSWVERNYPDSDIGHLLALDRVRRGAHLPAPVEHEPMRARTLRLLGTEWLVEAPLTGERFAPERTAA